MNLERTLSIVKPDAVRKNVIGKILDRFETAGLKVVACKMLLLRREQAEEFYAEHRERPFFDSLTNFMSSGPAIVMALDAPDAILRWRPLMGATDPAQAADGTLRKRFGLSIEHNATHGSDAPETAAFELGYFFRGVELD